MLLRYECTVSTIADENYLNPKKKVEVVFDIEDIKAMMIKHGQNQVRRELNHIFSKIVDKM